MIMKLVFYQVLTRLWGNGRFSSFTEKSLRYIKELGADYVWFTGIPRHATGEGFVKGDPGSPYAVSDWMDTNPYLADDPAGRLEEFRALAARTHDAGLKLCMDFIPNHVARNYAGPIPHHDWYDCDWSDTLKVDWYDPGTVPCMIDILRFWVDAGVDAFRCDMVELVPAEALGSVISTLKAEHPGLLFIAEVYGKDNYRKYLDTAHFDLLYDKSGAYDTLRGIRTRGWSTEGLTWNWQWLGDMQTKMLNFLENHDEQRVPFWSGDPFWPAVAHSLLFNTASFMLYFGQETGEDAAEGAEGRTSIFNWAKPAKVARIVGFAESGVKLPDAEEKVLARFRSLLALSHRPEFATGKVWDLCYCQSEEGGFDRHGHFAFIRYSDTGAYLVLCNFTNRACNVKLTVPIELEGLLSTDYVELSVAPLDFAIYSFSE